MTVASFGCVGNSTTHRKPGNSECPQTRKQQRPQPGGSPRPFVGGIPPTPRPRRSELHSYPHWRKGLNITFKPLVIPEKYAQFARPQFEPEKILEALQANKVALISLIAIAVGSRVSATLGVGWMLIAGCLATSGMGYLACFQQAFKQERQTSGVNSGVDFRNVVVNAYKLAGKQFGFKADMVKGPAAVVSAFYEPSPLYLMLNCWGLYAVGQYTVCSAFGGPTLLAICIASLLIGRFLQTKFWQLYGDKHKTDTSTQPTSNFVQQIAEILFMPVGTWGFGPVLNGVMWFACLSMPFVQYPASPVVMVPLWTALWVPALLLIEDIVSLVLKDRRDMKFACGSGPGLQLGSFLVGISCALFLRNLPLLILPA